MKKLIIFLCIVMVCSYAFSEEGVVRDGSSIEKAMIVEYNGDYQASIGSEYAYIGTLYGREYVDYNVLMQSNILQDSRSYDVIEIELIPSGEKRGVYFDVTELMKQWKF